MTDAETVVDAFGARREWREPAALLDASEAPAPAGQHLVRIGLVADVPDQTVVRRVEYVVQGDGEFDGAEPGGEVAAHRADRVDQEFAQFRRERGEFPGGERTQVGGRLDRVQQRSRLLLTHAGSVLEAPRGA